MAHYFVGDVQGCFLELNALLNKVDFNPSKDQLWSVGDLVARGPDSLATLRFFHQLGESAKVVLGNHDLHLLALAAGIKKPNPKDQLQSLLDAHDLPMLTDWLRQQPLVRELPQYHVLMSHAGIPPQWDLNTLRAQSSAVSAALQSNDYVEQIISRMYHSKPAQWHQCGSSFEKLLFSIDGLTRMRYLHRDGSLNFSCKQPPELCTDNSLVPWYQASSELRNNHTLVFGHWAALMGNVPQQNLQALDTGCVWGGNMTLWHIETNEKITQKKLPRKN
ncbi:symmetrical bis(5'-nucleosyl)-tetraphosphatase [Parashewanella spongiae]|uniref:bis(5'-nucleosyl)-tetraphosphatase (symmetrical) n=1 Tax=Parashewanella spongiae TaxID=342950 RepID=A0A3A6TZB3_9GAMM|nr:symmetrical bis(5'-nucleosyl)-tetraphosphatase [Parashewanella spongiae]MCL1076677.1 symmetrical bis(5'-nucleosyl)-tetraphosphatase [Parashewanella spongiae]RJY18485.1 symmetrical bis(5'-nucleosyl)-tetraphosphatase [Parashewanella spongiae]